MHFISHPFILCSLVRKIASTKRDIKDKGNPVKNNQNKKSRSKDKSLQWYTVMCNGIAKVQLHQNYPNICYTDLILKTKILTEVLFRSSRISHPFSRILPNISGFLSPGSDYWKLDIMKYIKRYPHLLHIFERVSCDGILDQLELFLFIEYILLFSSSIFDLVVFNALCNQFYVPYLLWSFIPDSTRALFPIYVAIWPRNGTYFMMKDWRIKCYVTVTHRYM